MTEPVPDEVAEAIERAKAASGGDEGDVTADDIRGLLDNPPPN